jgi:hypothetical protein
VIPVGLVCSVAPVCSGVGPDGLVALDGEVPGGPVGGVFPVCGVRSVGPVYSGVVPGGLAVLDVLETGEVVVEPCVGGGVSKVFSLILGVVPDMPGGPVGGVFPVCGVCSVGPVYSAVEPGGPAVLDVLETGGVVVEPCVGGGVSKVFSLMLGVVPDMPGGPVGGVFPVCGVCSVGPVYSGVLLETGGVVVEPCEGGGVSKVFSLITGVVVAGIVVVEGHPSLQQLLQSFGKQSSLESS